MSKPRASIPPTRPRLLPAVPHPFALPHPIEPADAGGRTEDGATITQDETPEPPADYRVVMASQQLPSDKIEAFTRFAMGLPMNLHHVAAVAGISIHGVANAVHRGRLRRRSMQAEAGFHPDDVRAWVWG
jgi:DNA-directed RNA polymerase specialized sigma24 family protein